MEHTADNRVKVGGCVLLCTLTDLPREIELPSVVPGTCEPENYGETVFIIVHGSSNAAHPVHCKLRSRAPGSEVWKRRE